MFRHIGIVVNKLDESIHFYKSLGFKVYNQRDEDSDFIDKISSSKNIKLHTVRLINDKNDMIELLDYGNHTELETRSLFGNGIAHFALTVENIDFYKSLGFISPPKVNPEGTVKVAFCVAPEGTFIELVEVLL